MIKRLLIFILVIIATSSSFGVNKSKITKIYINQLVEHPALNETTRGIVDGLAQAGYKNNKNLELRVESSQGNVSIASQIANKFVSNSPDIVVGVATIAAQSFSKYAKQSGTKLIFSSVTDPVRAGLVNDLNNPGNNTSGVSNFIPIEPQIAMFKKVKPSIKKLGFLYNPGEFNSISLIKKLKTVCPNFGIDLITMPAAKTSEVPGAAIKLSTTVDAIFISNDSTALSAMQTIIKAANEQNIPVFVSDTDIAQKGAIAALGPNQYKLGMQTARMIVRILNGENIDNQKVEFPTKIELLLNLKAAKKLDIEIDKTLISEANQFIK